MEWNTARHQGAARKRVSKIISSLDCPNLFYFLSFFFFIYVFYTWEKQEQFLEQGTKTNGKINGINSQNLLLLNMLRAETVNLTEKLGTKGERES